MASSSQVASVPYPSSDQSWKYDVFLSFRGPDTRKGITSDIYDGLTRRGVKTFFDDRDIEVGDAISPTLLAAIRGSRLAIVILSRDYASSSWCLEELREICECMKDNNRILPLFYEVEPTDVRHQKKSFEEAFSNHEVSGRHESEIVVQWRAALNKVANFSGWNTQDYKTHKELVNVIVEFVCAKVVPEAIECDEDFEVYEATKQAMDELLKALKDEKVTTIGVYGMGGVGKTTLVEHVGAYAQKCGLFDYVATCVVSQNPDCGKLQLAIAEQLGFKLDKKTEIGRASRLRKELKRREKLLIILDDTWERPNLSSIGIPNSRELRKSCSKVVLTTRIMNVCQECHKKIILNILSEEDSWALFMKTTGLTFKSSTFEGVARRVAKECNGLPIALIAVARALGDKDLAEWKRAAKRLEKSETANYDDDGKAFKCIKLSYYYLKDEKCKSLFLLCCLFPEDSNIEIDQLFKYGMGIGLFQDDETLKEGRDIAHSVGMHLIYSSLLWDGDNGHVRMHDVVRDAAIQIAQSERTFFVKAGCSLKDWPRTIDENCTAISLMRNDICKLPKTLVCPKLQILLLNENYNSEEIPETFFQSSNDLKVLDLSSRWRLSQLPQSISILTNLHFLSLCACDTSVLGKLNKLEILYLSNIPSRELSIELRGLTDLRIFSCDDEYILRIPPGVISEWRNLEELHLSGFWGWGVKVEEGVETINAGFEEVTSLSKLSVLKATVSDIEDLPTHVDLVPDWVEFNITIGVPFRYWDDEKLLLPCSRSLELKLDNISGLPEWFCDGLMKRAKSLHWNGCKNLSDIFVDLEHRSLPKLRHLILESFTDDEIEQSSSDEMGESFTDGEIEQNSSDEMGESFTQDESQQNPTRIPVLENLEKLSLIAIDCEESLEAVQTLPRGSLLNLKELYVKDSYKSKGNTLIPLAKSQILSNLEKIRIIGTSLRYIFGHDELVVSLPLNIRTMQLDNSSIIGICKGRTPPTMFQNLRILEISSCGQLEGSLFTHEVAQCLPQLDSLILEKCKLLDRIVEAGNNKTILPKLRFLYLGECPVLYCKNGSLDIECPSLETFYSSNCPKFAASFDDFNSRKQQIPYSWERLLIELAKILRRPGNSEGIPSFIRESQVLRLAVVDNKL